MDFWDGASFGSGSGIIDDFNSAIDKEAIIDSTTSLATTAIRERDHTEHPSQLTDGGEEGMQMNTFSSLVKTDSRWVSDVEAVYTCEFEVECECEESVIKILFRAGDDELECGDCFFRVGNSYFLLVGDLLSFFVLGVTGEEEKVKNILVEYDKDPMAFEWVGFTEVLATQLRMFI
ncbi:hypothetical protein BJ508DRAFT_324254 [Ascobolus immersus RN42]|uniref:Uncharacterized protein n=1 Tax=Ascobolus immersus RN42 TaxID=1160509 RepID=A0A3N4IQP4_ASCIM|nr:hypothetical protein BJ508DRAFT_324254 [Ascobolus immersus RN42]